MVTPDDILILEKELLPNKHESHYMVAGFHQWSNTGDISSGTAKYLIQATHAQKIGHIRHVHEGKNLFYVYQFPGAVHLRPLIKVVDGRIEDYQEGTNEFYYADVDNKGLAIFIGNEPHTDEDLYMGTLFHAARKLGVKRIVLPAGVGDTVPVDKERLIRCSYSLPQMREDLESYTVGYSTYEGPTTICMSIVNHGTKENMEVVRMVAITPSFPFNIPIVEQDVRGVYDILRRFKHMSRIKLNLSELESEVHKQTLLWESRLKQAFDALRSSLDPQTDAYVGSLEQKLAEFREIHFEEPVEVDPHLVKVIDEIIRKQEKQ